VFAVQPIGSDGEAKFPESVEEIAALNIAVIKEAQPNGPYYLGGYSFGGKIVFEMAAQLYAAGEATVFLAIFDGKAPATTQYAKEEPLEDAQTMLEIAREYGVELNDEELQLLAHEDQFAQLKKERCITESASFGGGLYHLENILRTIRHYQKIRYQTDFLYPAKITLFRTNGKSVPQRASASKVDVALGWDKYSTQPVEIYFIEGDHHTMLREPHVESLAKLVSGCILKICGASE
jgi:thioesterase domain-containing protein